MKAKMNKWCTWIENCDPQNLDNTYKNALLNAGFKILKECEWFFEPYGYTKLYLLAESHFAIHTFPEENRTYLELSSCVNAPFKKFLESIGELYGKRTESNPTSA